MNEVENCCLNRKLKWKVTSSITVVYIYNIYIERERGREREREERANGFYRKKNVHTAYGTYVNILVTNIM